MTFHAFAQYLEYKWRAKDRHGIHSPFVYTFIEEILNDKNVSRELSKIHLPEIHPPYDLLAGKIISHYNLANTATHYKEAEYPASLDAIILNADNPKQWSATAQIRFPYVKPHCFVFVPCIHKTKAHTAAWRGLCTNQAVHMSIDVYGLGLLLFRSEFKEKQHFILKY